MQALYNLEAINRILFETFLYDGPGDIKSKLTILTMVTLALVLTVRGSSCRIL